MIDELGGFGCWQRVVYFIIYTAEIFGAFGMLVPVLIGATPRWRCVAWSNSTGDVNATNSSDYFQCYKDDLTCSSYSYEDDFTSIVSQVDAKSVILNVVNIIYLNVA